MNAKEKQFQTTKTSHLKYPCSVEVTVDVIGGKWKSVILFHLLEDKQRFNELRRMMPKITQRMLTLQLRELEQDGIIHRKIYNEIPARVEYSITDFGKTLIPVLHQMREWGNTYTDTVIKNKDEQKFGEK